MLSPALSFSPPTRSRFPVQNAFLLFFSGAMLVVSLACAGRQSPGRGPVLYAESGQTLKQLVDSLPVTGGTVVLGPGTWASGYTPAEVLSKPNITIPGSGMPAFNSDFTAMTGGTIVLAPFNVSSGADFLIVRDLGVDAGQSYIDLNNGGIAMDAFAIFNKGQVLGAAPVQSPIIENVSCLGSSPTAAVHCMLVENVNNAYVHNVQTVMNQHGLVLKGTNSKVDGVFARGHGIDSVIVKSDAYAPAAHDTLLNIATTPLKFAGDTKGIVIIGVGAAVSDIDISHVSINSPLAWGVYVQGASATTSATRIILSNIVVDYPGGSPTDEYCMQFVQYVNSVTIQNLNCLSMWIGIAPYLPDSNFFTDFTVVNSHFRNVATDAIDTYGSWNILNSRFISIAGNGIVNPYGVTAVSGNTFLNIGGSDMLSTGGTFVESKGTTP